MSNPDERPVDELGHVYAHVIRRLDAVDDDVLEDVYATVLPLPDGRVAAVGDWTSSDLAAVRARAGRTAT